MKILLTGATGFIGGHCLRALLQQGYTVRAGVRNSDQLKKIYPEAEAVRVDFAKMQTVEDWLPLLTDIEVVINCVGIIAETATQKFNDLHQKAPIALFQAAAQANVKKIIQISALGADEQAQSAYHLTKKAADDVLVGLNLDWFILKPSVVYGDGAQSMAMFHAFAALPVEVLMDDGQQLLQPVHVEDVVATILQCLNPQTQGKRILNVVGAEPVSYKNLLAQLRTRLDKKSPLSFKVPSKIMLSFAGLGGFLDIPALSRDGLQMLLRGNSADKQPLTEFLGRVPASLQEKLFSKPATVAEKWHASLFFLPLILRFTLAFIWLWSGLISAFVYPAAQSYQLLVPLGITGIFAVLTLYGLALLDVLIGLATLCRYRLKTTLLVQILIIIGYSLVISYALPEFLFHPFAPIIKNLPLIICAGILLILEE